MNAATKNLESELIELFTKLQKEGVLQPTELQVQLNAQETIDPPAQWVSNNTSNTTYSNANS